ncbi:hypothetical protein [uncultured Croceicoccus sp.]|uniref:hypothetical protein n=1 Tax=uncultured Croceicoccus sp. TaxID=1295329 RepID=UPI00263A3AC5|nr:hypothetical protein [uncultured Croceicoccus sp.]
MAKTILTLTMAALLPLLSGCNDTADAPAEAEGAAAQGEVLPGTIDDAMIPFDQLQSQGMPVSEAEGEGETAGEDADDADIDTETDAATPDAEPED